ncbi:MAG: sigma-54-dependent Fis family transcriptional regulator [Bryobacterales bacterium]|nr:sigma-54-dependent Fis family transcriptional regulator [Bryobacterales bacterium]
MAKPPILLIDDDEAITATLTAFLTSRGYPVETANEGEEGLSLARTGRFPIVLSDIYIDRVSGLEILRAARAGNPEAAVILMTAHGSVRTTVEAESGGAFDYLAKPFEMSALLEVVERAERARSAPAAVIPEGLEEYGEMVGASPAMVEVYKRIARTSRCDETVLITGETGVGKELVARAIHRNSARAERPFVAIDSGAVAGTLWESEVFGSVRGAFTGADRDRPGMVEAARGGTLFFDEVGEVPVECQAKLLRLLQEKEYRPVGAAGPRKADVRIIAATNRPIDLMLKEQKIREDLFYRLNVLRIDVPPLRERRSDIALLARRFLAGQERIWLTPEALRFLERHNWPGNVRQLENTLRRLIVLSPPGPVSRLDIERALAPAAGEAEEPTELDERERQQILRVLEQTAGNKSRAAELLGIQRRTLYKKLARMGIEGF